MALAIALLAVAASASSLRNGFTYDDRWIIVENGRVHAVRALWHYFDESYWPMRSGAQLYRPFVIIAYSVQWMLGGGTPLVFHIVSVLLAAACAVGVFWVAGFLVTPGVAWLAAAFFAVHPVHVEAIANVVGQAELWAALIVLLAFGLYARDRRDGALRRETGVLIWALFTAGLFTKEHVVVLPALLVAAELLLYRDVSLWHRLRRLRLLLWPMLASVAVFLALRVRVIGDIGGDIAHPSLHRRSMLERMYIMLDVVPEYGRLLLWPERLYADYSMRQLMVHATPDVSQLAGVLLLVGAVVCFALAFRRAPMVAFGLAWFALLIAPVSNVLLPTGILLAERTLYLPSVGAMLVLAIGVSAAHARLRADGSVLRRAVPLVCAVLLALGVGRSAVRNGFWHDTDSAFAKMVDDAPLNFKAHYAWGGQLFERQRRKEGELEWRVAIALMPDYYGVYMDSGAQVPRVAPLRRRHSALREGAEHRTRPAHRARLRRGLPVGAGAVAPGPHDVARGDRRRFLPARLSVHDRSCRQRAGGARQPGSDDRRQVVAACGDRPEMTAQGADLRCTGRWPESLQVYCCVSVSSRSGHGDLRLKRQSADQWRLARFFAG